MEELYFKKCATLFNLYRKNDDVVIASGASLLDCMKNIKHGTNMEMVSVKVIDGVYKAFLKIPDTFIATAPACQIVEMAENFEG